MPALLAGALCGCPTTDDGPSGDTEPDTGDSTGGEPAGPVTPERLASRGDCPAADGPGTDHSGDVTADEIWSAAAGPHRVPNHLRILATVTIEPCALVLVGPGIEIDVGSSSGGGRLVAHGEATDEALRPVNLQAADPAQPWGRLYVAATGELELSVAALQDGGAAASGDPGALVVAGVAGGTNGGEPTASTTLDRVLIADAASHGLNLTGWGALTDASTELWIRGCGSEANPAGVRIEPGVAASLPDGLALSDNLRDEILMTTSKAFMRDDTLRDHGVPYHQRGTLYVNAGEDGATATLTIEPGVTVAFEDNAGSGVIVGSSDARPGVLVADGTADAPIVFTSALDTPAAGDWMGVVFAYVPTSGAHISEARIEYAGGESGHSSYGCGPGDNDAAIIVHGQGPDDAAPDPVVEYTAFDHIGGDTVIVSGWTDDAGPNLSETNTFGADTGGCKVSRPQRTGAGDTCDGGRTTCWP